MVRFSIAIVLLLLIGCADSDGRSAYVQDMLHGSVALRYRSYPAEEDHLEPSPVGPITLHVFKNQGELWFAEPSGSGYSLPYTLCEPVAVDQVRFEELTTVAQYLAIFGDGPSATSMWGDQQRLHWTRSIRRLWPEGQGYRGVTIFLQASRVVDAPDGPIAIDKATVHELTIPAAKGG